MYELVRPLGDRTFNYLEGLIPEHIPDANGINGIVSRLRRNWMAVELGYVPPIFFVSEPDKNVKSVINNDHLTEDDVPSSVIKSNVQGYLGSVSNYQAAFGGYEHKILAGLNLDEQNLKAAFNVTADFVSPISGEIDGHIEHQYVLMTAPPRNRSGEPLKFGMTTYTNEQLDVPQFAVLMVNWINRRACKRLVNPHPKTLADFDKRRPRRAA